MSLEPYQRLESTKQFDRRFLTKLVRNYRSHPDILEIPSELFYEDELMPCADETRRQSLCNWNELPTPVRFSLAPLIRSPNFISSPRFFCTSPLAAPKGSQAPT